MATSRSFAGRAALVTGGSGGIGAAICRRLAQEGAAVAVGYGRSEDAAREVVARITADGGRAAAAGADLRTHDGPAELAGKAEEALGAPLDIVVSNAGVGRATKLADVSVEEFDEAIAVNLRAPFLLAQRVLPGMQERRYGRLLFVSSVAAFTGGIVGPHYAASKAGLHGLVHFLASRTAGMG